MHGALVVLLIGLLAACGGSPNAPATQTRTAEIVELSVVARTAATATTPSLATPTAGTATTAAGGTPAAVTAAPTTVLLPTRAATGLPTRGATTSPTTGADRGSTVAPPAQRTPAASTPAAGAGARVPLAPNAAGTVQAGRVAQRVTIIRLTDNAKDSSGLNPPSRASNKYVTIEVILANTGTAPLLRSATAWRVQTTAGDEAPDTIPTGLGQPLEFSTLAPGATLQGVVAFEVPASATVRWIRYRYTDGATVGDLYFDVA